MPIWAKGKRISPVCAGLKEGKHNDILFFLNGIEKLKPKPETVVLFMPCSTQQKYGKRFKKMADYVCDECSELVCGISYIKVYRWTGKPALAKGRAYAKLERNYFLQEDLAGKEVILVDDIFTTGSSLQDFRKEVETTGGNCNRRHFRCRNIQDAR